MNRLNKFTTAYVTCALWCGVFDESIENDLNHDLTPEDISDNTLHVMVEDCTRFWGEIKDLVPSGTEVQGGHDFWLTRNGHGAGFWDSPEVYGEDIADNLTVLAKNFRTRPEGKYIFPSRTPEFELYIGDDGKVYHV